MRMEGTIERRAPDGLRRAYFRYALLDWEWQALVAGDGRYRSGLPEEYPWTDD
jgi:hypothetical protein